MKDTTMLLIQISCIGIGVLFLYLGAFVFMNHAQVQYVLPSVIAGIFISVIPIFREALREHSRKPDSFYEILRTNTPEPRIDIFARYRHFGFDSYGNEVQKDIQLPLTAIQNTLGDNT